MITQRLKIDSVHPEKELIETGAQLLEKEELVAFPTETIYGLGGDARSEAAIRAVYEIKGRPNDKPLPVMVASYDMVFAMVSKIPKMAEKLMEAFWPGPLTLVLPAKASVSPLITANGKTVGIRFPDHPIPIQLIQQLNHPIVAPSANLSGNPSPTDAAGVLQQLSNRIALVLDGGICSKKEASTVVDCTNEKIQILRHGALSIDSIMSVVPC